MNKGKGKQGNEFLVYVAQTLQKCVQISKSFFKNSVFLDNPAWVQRRK